MVESAKPVQAYKKLRFSIDGGELVERAPLTDRGERVAKALLRYAAEMRDPQEFLTWVCPRWGGLPHLGARGSTVELARAMDECPEYMIGWAFLTASEEGLTCDWDPKTPQEFHALVEQWIGGLTMDAVAADNAGAFSPDHWHPPETEAVLAVLRESIKVALALDAEESLKRYEQYAAMRSRVADVFRQIEKYATAEWLEQGNKYCGLSHHEASAEEIAAYKARVAEIAERLGLEWPPQF